MAEQETPASVLPQRSTVRHLHTNKNGSETALNPLKKHLQLSRTKNLRITAQKEKEKQLHFACIVPSPRPAQLRAQRELLHWKGFPLMVKEELGK